MSKKKTIQKFIMESKIIHGDTYDYSQSIYVNNHTKVKIICPIHGPFEIRPNDHIGKKVGCAKCNYASLSKSKNISKNIVKRFHKIHNYKYDYSLMSYTGTDNKITIICPVHGEFRQTPHHHLSGSGCQKCGNVYKKTTKEFIEESIKVHGNKYNYSLVDYKNNAEKVKIICHTHGVFEVRPNDHINKKSGCRECLKGTFDEFLVKARKVHQYRYDYSEVKYVSNHNNKIKILCKSHGEFLQLPSNHINGHGCPICKLSKGELEIKKFLDENNVKYIREKKFKECRDKRMLSFDFYLPKQHMCIEFDGEQHFKSINYFGGKTNYEEIKKRDLLKDEFCEKNNIKLIRFNKTNLNDIYKLFRENLLLLK